MSICRCSWHVIYCVGSCATCRQPGWDNKSCLLRSATPVYDSQVLLTPGWSGDAWHCEVSDSLSGVRDASEPRSHLAMLVLLDVNHKRGLRTEEKSRHQKPTHQEHSPTYSIPMHCSIGCPTLTTQSMPHFHIMTARNASQSCKRNPSPEAATQLQSVPIPQATSQPLARQLC